MNSTATFSPDGLSSRPTSGNRHDGSRDHAANAGKSQGTMNQVIHYAAVNDHHGYDDGLVHSHNWAASSAQ